MTVTLDITERKIAEEEIKKARLAAEESNLAKSEFLSRMSHELRTPMNSILGFAQLLQMGDLLPRQKTGVSHILHSGKHLLDLINEVLDISRIEAGRISLSLEPVQLNTGDGVGQACLDSGRLGDVGALVADRSHAAEHDVVDRPWIQLLIADQGLVHQADHKVDRLGRMEGTTAFSLAAWRTNRVEDQCVSAHEYSIKGRWPV